MTQMDQERRKERSGRRRHLTILFSDLSGSVSLSASMEAEDYADLLHNLRDIFEHVVAKHGGTIVQILGDGFLACFGYPDAAEDDGRRAVEAALDLHEAVRGQRIKTLGPVGVPGWKALSLHSGIHTGLVLVNDGDDVSGKIRIFGNAINIAARFSQTAKTDEIIVSAGTLGSERNFFKTDYEKTVEVSGITGALSVCAIRGRARVATRYEARLKRGLTPFTGRGLEFSALMDGLRTALTGGLQYFAIAAPLGYGKTRLAEEFLSSTADSCQIFRGYCEAYLSAEPAQPFLQMLRAFAGIEYGQPAGAVAEALHDALLRTSPALLADEPVFLRALSTAASQDAGSQNSATGLAKLASAFARLCDALAAVEPVILFIDDWQWADDASRQLLDAIRALAHRPIFILVSTRDDDLGAFRVSNAQVLKLEPLSESETEEAIAHLLPGQSNFVLQAIRDLSGGNPLFAEELCHSAAHDLEKPTYQDSEGLAWLKKLVAARVERLPDDQIDLVRAAAVIGNVIPLRVLTAITGYPATHPLLQALENEDLIYRGEQPGTLRFKHGIARDIIYDSVGLRERKAMHLRIAEALKQQLPGSEEEFYEPLAYHYGEAGELVEASRYAELAGDKAMAAAAVDRAQMQYLAALTALRLLPASNRNYERWMSISERFAMVCIADSSWRHLEVLFETAKRAGERGDEIAIARTDYWIGYIYYALGEARLAISHLEKALGRAATLPDERFVAQIKAVLGQAYAAGSSYVKALQLADDAIQWKLQQGRKTTRTPVNLPYALACKAEALGDMGQFKSAIECLDQAWEMVRESGHQVKGSILCHRSAVLIWQGRWEEAHDAARQAVDVGEQVKSLYIYGISSAMKSYASWKQNHSPEDVQQLADAVSWLENSGRRLFLSTGRGWLAECFCEMQRWEDLRREAARAIRRDRHLDRLGNAAACRAMARASVRGESLKPFTFYLGLAAENAKARQSAHELASNQLCEAELRLVVGERDQAARLLDRAETAFRSMDMHWHLEKTVEVQSMLNSVEEQARRVEAIVPAQAAPYFIKLRRFFGMAPRFQGNDVEASRSLG
jgi:class 3 adenylate cyclase